MLKLFLDDTREPWDKSWDRVNSAAKFKKYLKTKRPDVISFDHDLHPEHYKALNFAQDIKEYKNKCNNFIHETGLDCAKWMCLFYLEEGIPIPEINIHSANEIGAQFISSYISNHLLMYFEEERLLIPKNYHTGAPLGF